MSAVLERAESGFDDLLSGDIIGFLEHTVELSLYIGIVFPVEMLFKAMGITDHDVIKTNVSSQRLINPDEDKDIMKTLFNKVVLAKMQDGGGTYLSNFMEMSQSGRSRFSSYFTFGRDKFTDGLPDSSINKLILDPADIKPVIDTIYGTSSTILSTKITIPTDNEWVLYYLQNNYNFRVNTDKSLTYNSKTYTYDSYVFNTGTGVYDITIKQYETVTTSVYGIEEVIITPKAGSTTIDIKTTNIKERTVVVGSIRGVISDTTVLISTSEEEIPKESQTGYIDEELVSTTVQNDVVIDTVVLNLSPFNYEFHYIVLFNNSSNEEFIWIYNPNNNTYPTLALTQYETSSLDMLPVVTLRNSGVNTNSDKTSDRYKESKRMLKVLGIDLDAFTDEVNKNPDIAQVEDAFIHFGVSPHDTGEEVSKILWKTFEYIELSNSASVSDGNKSVTFSEQKMNLALSWSDGEIRVETGTLPVGSKKYHHEIVDGSYDEESVDNDGNTVITQIATKTLVLKEKLTSTTLKVIRLTNLTNVSIIKRDGMSGGVSVDVTSKDFFIPLSYYLIKQLTPLEQFVLFAKTLRITVYAAQIVHVKWYETSAFAAFVKIVGFIIIIIVTIWTLGSGTKPAAAVIGGLIKAIAVAFAINLALKAIFRMTDNTAIRAIATVVAVVVSLYAGGYFSGESLTAFQALMIPLATTLSVASMALSADLELKFKELEGNSNAFSEARDARMGDIDRAQGLFNTDISASDVTALNSIEEISPFIFGPTAFYYLAKGEATYNSYSLLYENAVNNVKDFYVKEYRLGII